MTNPNFAGDHEIQRRETVWKDFLEHVLHLPWAFVSDQSSLGDFEGLMDSAELIRRVRVRYGLELRTEHQTMPLYQFLDLLEPPAQV